MTAVKSRIATATAAFLLTGLAGAQTVPPTLAPAEIPTNAEAPVDVEIFKGVRSKRVNPPAYPQNERRLGRDGWVHLNFMVDPQGKPYEIMVTDSTGNEELEKAAIKAAEKWEFEPATLQGVPIDSGHTMKINFVLSGGSGADPSFIKAYKGFAAATKSKDRALADAALAKMKVQNLYEDAYYNLAQFEYARIWGTQAQQLTAIKRAIAEEGNANYLPKSTFVAGLDVLLGLQIKTNNFAGALETWKKLQKLADAELLARWQPIIDKVIAIRGGNTPYAVEGEFGDTSSWYFPLFRKRFQIALTSGHVADIKLRCDKRYVFFKFDPQMLYSISDKYGACSMELVGDPGTKFQLIQS
jgi:TonB family protein